MTTICRLPIFRKILMQIPQIRHKNIHCISFVSSITEFSSLLAHKPCKPCVTLPNTNSVILLTETPLISSVKIILFEYAAKPLCESETKSQALCEFQRFIHCKQLVFVLRVKPRRTTFGPL
jgi:hypothetical protein